MRRNWRRNLRPRRAEHEELIRRKRVPVAEAIASGPDHSRPRRAQNGEEGVEVDGAQVLLAQVLVDEEQLHGEEQREREAGRDADDIALDARDPFVAIVAVVGRRRPRRLVQAIGYSSCGPALLTER